MNPRLRWLAAVAVAAASVLATPALPAAASATAQPVADATNHAAACATSRPHSGAILHSGIRGGLGTLTIKNHLSQDAAVILVLGRSKAISVYVRTHATSTVGNVKNGTYTIYFTSGARFSVCQGLFTSGATYWRVNQRLPFTGSPPEYTAAILTLYSVNGGGNAPTTQVSPSGFPKA